MANQQNDKTIEIEIKDENDLVREKSGLNAEKNNVIDFPAQEQAAESSDSEIEKKPDYYDQYLRIGHKIIIH